MSFIHPGRIFRSRKAARRLPWIFHEKNTCSHFYLCYNRCDHTANQPFAKSGRSSCRKGALFSNLRSSRRAISRRPSRRWRRAFRAACPVGCCWASPARAKLYDGLRHRACAAPNAGHRAQQDAGRAALRRVSRVLSGQRGPSISSLTTIITSRRRTSPPPIPILKRIPPSTKRSSACATARRRRCASGGM